VLTISLLYLTFRVMEPRDEDGTGQVQKPYLSLSIEVGFIMMGQQGDARRELGWRVVLSIVLVFAWLIFLVIWLFFLTPEMGWGQNLAVFLLSLLVVSAILVLTWVTWAMERPPTVQQAPGYPPMVRPPKWKAALNGSAVIFWLSFMIIWLFFFANDFSLYQNFGVVLASLLVIGGVTWAIGLIAR
jgi:hypothetical protein